MENPYSPTQLPDEKTRSSPLVAFLQRLAAVVLYVAGWILLGIVVVPAMTRLHGEMLPLRTPESELTTFESFSRFCVHYWFTAFVFLSPPVCFVTWVLLKRNGIKKTRWLLLTIGLAIAPALLEVAWLLFRSLLFPP